MDNVDDPSGAYLDDACRGVSTVVELLAIKGSRMTEGQSRLAVEAINACGWFMKRVVCISFLCPLWSRLTILMFIKTSVP